MPEILRRISVAMCIIISSLMMVSCVTAEDWDDSPSGNLEALWKIIDEHYCFFGYKAKEYGLDWNDVHQRYSKRINPEMNDYQLFEVLTEMLSELKDGHVNLYASFDMGRNWSWYEDYPRNFSEDIQMNYLGKDYKIASGIYYKILDDNIGYLYCSSFSNGIGDGNLSQVMNALASCRGLIVDVRDNSGGELTNADRLASRFTNEKILTGYMAYKTGKGHDDFSSLKELYLEPSDGIRWQKKAVVLTNRKCYSATNDFVKTMRQCPGVTVIGDRTGGGSGLPFSSELPNGWSVRFSACPTYDVDKKDIEFGIEPDIKVSLTDADRARGVDTLIEFAREFLKK